MLSIFYFSREIIKYDQNEKKQPAARISPSFQNMGTGLCLRAYFARLYHRAFLFFYKNIFMNVTLSTSSHPKGTGLRFELMKSLNRNPSLALLHS